MAGKASSLEARAVFAADATRRLAAFGDAELKLLRVFCTVVAAGGFSAATAELQVDLSTISRQFKELEALADARLASRGRGGFVLTPAGEELHRLATQLLASIRTFGDGLAGLARHAAPTLRLGMLDALLTAQTPGQGLAAALGACAAACPGLRIELRSLRPIEIERRVMAGELDAGIVAARPPAAGLEQHALFSERSSLYVAPGHPWYASPQRPLGPAALAAAAFVADPFWVDMPHAELSGLGPPAARADNVESAALLILSGAYAGFLPDHLAEAWPALAALRRVLPGRFSYAQDIALTCKRGNVAAPVRQLLKALLAQGAGKV